MNDIINSSILENIINSYNSLWKVKVHGKTIEIVTPIATTNNMFVSVFITRRGDDFIVTDGGWIDSGAYECEIGFEDSCYSKLFQYYLDDYEIQSLDNRYTYYYKKISDLELIPNLVYDLSSFINAVISASFISFEERKEKEQIGRFRRDANDFFKKLVDEKHLKTNSYIHEGLSLIKFSAVVQMKCGMALVNYVTGSNDSNFILSLGKSNLNYDMVEKHSINRYVKQKITLMDDTTKIIQSARVIPYLSVLDSKEGRVNLKWKDKDRIKEMIELP